MNTFCGPHETGFIEPYRLLFNFDCSEDRCSFPIAMLAKSNSECAEWGTLESLATSSAELRLAYSDRQTGNHESSIL